MKKHFRTVVMTFAVIFSLAIPQPALALTEYDQEPSLETETETETKNTAYISQRVAISDKYTLSEKQKAYVDHWFELCIKESVDHNLPWQVPMAQGILEGGAGTTEVAVNNHNHHGITSKNGGFRYFESDEAGWHGYFDNIESTGVYSQNGIYETFDNPENCIGTLIASGYAEDEQYVEKLSHIVMAVEKYRLEKGWPTSAEYADQVETTAQNTWEEKVDAITQDILAERTASESGDNDGYVNDGFDNAFHAGIKRAEKRGHIGAFAIIGGFIDVYNYYTHSEGAV